MENQNNILLYEGAMLNDRYCIRQMLHYDEYGIIYRAIDYNTDSEVIVKEFFLKDVMYRDPKEGMLVYDTEEARNRYNRGIEHFSREADILEFLNNENVPNISRYRDSFSQNGTEYLVMNMYSGKSLNEFCHERKSIPASALFVMIGNTLEALKHMHSLGIIHRDISPDNLILNRDGDLILTNFERATSMSARSLFYSKQELQPSDFESPEHGFLELQGAYTDIYSLCATMYYLLTGKIPPTVKERANQDPVPSELKKLNMNDAMNQILIKGLQIVRNERYQCVEEIMDDMYGFGKLNYSAYQAEYAVRVSNGDRKENQDNFILDKLYTYEGHNLSVSGVMECEPNQYYMAAVCDGVGGAKFGDIASGKIATALWDFLDRHRTSKRPTYFLLEQLVIDVNEQVIRLGEEIGPTASTLTLLLWRNDEYYILNVGDSPLFYFSHDELRRLSVYQTKHDLYQKIGSKPLKQDAHTMINYIGRKNVPAQQMIHYRHGKIYKDDLFLLCSDGVSDRIPEGQLFTILRNRGIKSLQLIYQLLELNMNNDNSTAILIQF